mgnify:FL=1
MKIRIVDLLKSDIYGIDVYVRGWVRTHRQSKNISFIALNDGSTVHNLQIVIEHVKFEKNMLKTITTGSAIGIKGKFIRSAGGKQQVEVIAGDIEVYGIADPQGYPLQKKEHSLEYLREIAHLRLRTNTFGAIFRIRHNMAFAIHRYFNERGFFYFNTPIITTSDSEGAGELFEVKTELKDDFFGSPANLTVSGQLEGELGALALGAIYTFSPTFRAENSNTFRHLSEFWMIEPEVAFNDINDNMDLAEDFLKYLIRYALENCESDLAFLNDNVDNGLMDKLHFVANNEFMRLPYSKAIEILQESGRQFDYPVKPGIDLCAEHERHLVEEYFRRPVIVTDYPKEIKAFYMKQNEDGKTVRAMDVLFPKIGEIIGGSEREADYTKLLQRMKELNMNTEKLWWYLESRKFGTVPHSGFGLGFERLMLFITGMTNIRDVIPFPRTPRNANF